jgi:hypothetical protein
MNSQLSSSPKITKFTSHTQQTESNSAKLKVEYIIIKWLWKMNNSINREEYMKHTKLWIIEIPENEASSIAI